VAGLVKRDEHAWDDFAQAPVLSVWEDRGVEPRPDRARIVMERGIGIDRDIEERVGWWFVVFNGAASSAFGVNAEVDLASLS